MRLRFTSITCAACGSHFDHVPVERDENGGYVVLEVKACREPGCGALLCACCDQSYCDGCGQLFCSDHLVSVPDGTETQLHCCPTCAAESEPLELPERIEPKMAPAPSQTAAPAQVQVTAR
jgi:hypothetical protein